jgi:hypothetical protein
MPWCRHKANAIYHDVPRLDQLDQASINNRPDRILKDRFSIARLIKLGVLKLSL